MKSKSEIINAICICVEEQPKCNDCPYYSDLECCEDLMKDALQLLNRSDFEVASEILCRSSMNRIYAEGPFHHCNDEYAISIPAQTDEINFFFDKDGNIL